MFSGVFLESTTGSLETSSLHASPSLSAKAGVLGMMEIRYFHHSQNTFPLFADQMMSRQT